MSLIGENIDPRLFLQDYSGYVRAGEIQAQGISSAISGVANSITDYAKDQKESKNALKAGQVQIEAAIKLFPDQAEYLGQIANELKNEDTPLSARAEISKQTADYISMAVGQKRYETDQHYREKELGFRERDQNMQERESTLRQHVTSLNVTAAENEASQAAVAQQTKEEMGTPLADSMLNLLRKSDPVMADKLAENRKDNTPAEDYSLANSIMQLIPKAERKAAPTVTDVPVAGGTQKMQWDEASSQWAPIQTSAPEAGPSDLIPFVAGLEGFNPKAYSDSGQTSIGFGTRARDGEKEITKEEASRRLQSELAASSKRVDDAAAAAGVVYEPNERNALISFDFNTGQGQSVISRFAGDKKALVSKMAEYNKLDAGDDAPSQGLINRRSKEIQLFTTPVEQVGFTPELTPAKAQDAKIQQEKHAAEMGQIQEKKAVNIAKSQQLITALDKLEKHPGFSNLFGTNIGVPTWVSGSSGADAKTIFKQIEGKGFIEAIQDMKGMGALSNAEGEKASAAFLGISPSMSEGAAKEQIKTIKELVAAGIARTTSGVFVNPDGTPKTAPQATREGASSRLGQMNGGN